MTTETTETTAAPAPVQHTPAPAPRRAAPPPPPEVDDPEDVVTETHQRERFRDPTPYERRLRTEAANLRQRALAAERDLETKLSAVQADAERRIADAEKRIADAAAKATKDAADAKAAAEAAAEQKVNAALTAAQQRTIRAEVRAAAIQAGLIHTKGLDMLDLSGVTLDDKGDVVLPDGFFEKAKEDMPFLFQAPPPVTGPKPATTSSTAAPPPSTPPTNKRATEMTPEEYREARRGLLHR